MPYLDRWEERLRTAVVTIGERGGSFQPVERASPATSDEVSRAETELGVGLPAQLTKVLGWGGLTGRWQLAEGDDGALPAECGEVQWGGVTLSLEEVVRAEMSRRGWIEACFPNIADSYEVVWHDKFGFHTIPNGDCLALGTFDDDMAVYYLSHDDGEGHGVRLAPSLEEFVERWSRLGFAGPEDWLLLPFVDVAKGGLVADSTIAEDWRASLGLRALGAA